MVSIFHKTRNVVFVKSIAEFCGHNVLTGFERKGKSSANEKDWFDGFNTERGSVDQIHAQAVHCSELGYKLRIFWDKEQQPDTVTNTAFSAFVIILGVSSA